MPPVPTQLDFDVWLEWIETVLLPMYGECAIKHKRTVAAWPK